MDRRVVSIKPRQRLLLVAAPHHGRDDPGHSAPSSYGITEVRSAIGAAGKHVTRIVGQRIGTCAPVIDVGWRYHNFLDERRRGVGPDMGLETVNRGTALVLDPVSISVGFAG